ncbi:hypothetical protein B0H63DRAFT_305427 [Podospora didyma]|uniref:BZIP domain-containing protein n=1 Tax=Podospora didyma TaxID=330526 RepID=A0AAE0N407_9PEZI|nr:hypothetical protein B0H63DRAFT_305427 [Podospora didyma]
MVSVNVVLNRDFEGAGESAVSSPASVASSSYACTPTSSTSLNTPGPQITIRPSTANRPPAINTSAAAAGRIAMSAAASPGATTPLTMTTKEWVIPPRPKPGRKPATDTPPTKRKAQNRAAQRAFRERRAARVGELEELLDDEREDHERTVRELQERVAHLETETQTLQSRCQWLEALLEKERQGREGPMAGSWESNSQQQHQQQQQPECMMIPLPRQHLQPLVPKNQPESILIPEPRPMGQSFSISQIISPPDEADGSLDLSCGNCQSNGPCACANEVLRNTDIIMGCGGCTIDTRCACLEESMRATIDLKRPLPPGSPSPSMTSGEKRQRSDNTGAPELMDMETDFTAMFGSRRNKEPLPSVVPMPDVHLHTQPQQPMMSVEARDNCGFCKDGSYCVCADSMGLASMSSFSAPGLSSGPQQLQQQQQQQQHITQQTHTPPPSEDDVVPMPMEVTATGAIKLPRFNGLGQSQQRAAATLTRPAATKAGGCGPNGPGTCTQCLSDPKSGLFCRSLAANFERNNRQQQAGEPASTSGGGGCCGNGGPGGCCMSGGDKPAEVVSGSINSAASGRPTTNNSVAKGGLGLSLSCAEAYKTLASHHHFNEAADDIGSWLPKLRAVPVPPELNHNGRGHLAGGGRAPIEVEAASIMSVLKDFDIRFGRGE